MHMQMYSLLAVYIYYCIGFIFCLRSFLGFHTAYYNEEGVLVTNPLMCAKHYLRTNFIFEFLANILPTDIFAFASKGTYASVYVLYSIH